MKYGERTALGQHLKSEDWDAMVDIVSGFSADGTFIAPYTYLILQNVVEEVTYYYANNAYQTIYGGPTNIGDVPNANTDMFVLLQTCMNDMLGEGGKIGIKEGTYVGGTGTALEPVSDVTIEGESRDSVIIQTADGHDEYSWDGTASNFTLLNLTLDGNHAGNADATSFQVTLTSSNIVNCVFKEFYGNAFNLGVDGSNENLVANCIFKDNTGDGLYVAGKRNRIINNLSYDNGDCGFVATVYGESNEFDSTDNLFFSNKAWNNGNCGFAFPNNKDSAYIGNEAFNNGVNELTGPNQSGFYFMESLGRYGQNLVIQDNVAYDSQGEGSETQLMGIYVGDPSTPLTEFCTIGGNNCHDNGSYDLVVGGDSHTVINNIANILVFAVTNSIVADNIGTTWTWPLGLQGSKVHHNTGYVTENGNGGVTGTGAEQTIAHGLSPGAPTFVSVVPTQTGTTVSNLWADATNLYVTVTAGHLYNWYAVYF